MVLGAEEPSAQCSAQPCRPARQSVAALQLLRERVPERRARGGGSSKRVVVAGGLTQRGVLVGGGVVDGAHGAGARVPGFRRTRAVAIFMWRGPGDWGTASAPRSVWEIRRTSVSTPDAVTPPAAPRTVRVVEPLCRGGERDEGLGAAQVRVLGWLRLHGGDAYADDGTGSPCPRVVSMRAR